MKTQQERKLQGWGCNSVAENLPSMFKVLDLIPSIAKNKPKPKQSKKEKKSQQKSNKSPFTMKILNKILGNEIQ
jgi:hypothetical protein